MTIISFDLNVEHSMSRDALSNWLEYINAFSDIKSRDPQTVDNFIADLTGIEITQYHCCTNSCMAYTGRYQDLDKCKFCQHK